MKNKASRDLAASRTHHRIPLDSAAWVDLDDWVHELMTLYPRNNPLTYATCCWTLLVPIGRRKVHQHICESVINLHKMVGAGLRDLKGEFLAGLNRLKAPNMHGQLFHGLDLCCQKYDFQKMAPVVSSRSVNERGYITPIKTQETPKLKSISIEKSSISKKVILLKSCKKRKSTARILKQLLKKRQ